MNSIFSDFYILLFDSKFFNFTERRVRLYCGFCYVSEDSFGAEDFSVDECSRWGVKNRLELEKMTNFKIMEIFV